MRSNNASSKQKQPPLTPARLLMGISLAGATFVANSATAQIETTFALPADFAVRSPGGVNMVDGQYSDETPHISLGDPALGGFEVSRTFKKNKAPSTNWHYEITRRGNSAEGWYFTVENSGSNATFFSQTGEPPYRAINLTSDGGLSTLDRITSGSNKYFVYTAADGTTIRFRASADGWNQYAEELKKTNGLAYNFTYDVSGETRLRRVKSNAGFELIFEYLNSPNQIKISKICAINLSKTTSPATAVCPIGEMATSYTYSGNRITSITNPLGAAYIITSNFVDNLTPFQESFYKPGYTQPYLVNSYAWDPDANLVLYVARQDFADGRAITYTPILFGTEWPQTASRLESWTENSTAVTYLGWGVYQRDYRYKPAITPGPVTVSDPLGRTTGTGYSGDYRRILSRAQPNGMREQYTYNPNGSITQRTLSPPSGSPETPLTVSFTYDCTVAINCKKPATMTDARGYVTNYVYDATHGGLLSEMAPPPVAGGARPLKLLTYVQKYAYVKNSAGTLVPATTPVWVPATETQCQTAAGSSTPICDGGAAQAVTTFEYAAAGIGNTLLPRGTAVTADGQTLRTCYGYDTSGRKISETKPSANLSVCP